MSEWTRRMTCSRYSGGPCAACGEETFFAHWSKPGKAGTNESRTVLCERCYEAGAALTVCGGVTPEEKTLRSALAKIKRALTPRERKVLRERFGIEVDE